MTPPEPGAVPETDAADGRAANITSRPTPLNDAAYDGDAEKFVSEQINYVAEATEPAPEE